MSLDELLFTKIGMYTGLIAGAVIGYQTGDYFVHKHMSDAPLLVRGVFEIVPLIVGAIGGGMGFAYVGSQIDRTLAG